MATEWNIEKIKKVIKGKSFILVSTEFKTTKTKLEFQCLDCGDLFWARAGAIISGGGCPRTGKTFSTKEKQSLINKIKNEIKFLLEYSNGKGKWECLKCNNTWSKSYFTTQGHGTKLPTKCIRCYPESKAKKWNIKSIKEELIKKGINITLQSLQYLNTESDLQWQCNKCNFVWTNSWGVQKKTKGCSKCLNCKKLTKNDILNKIKGSSLTIYPTTDPKTNRFITWKCKICATERIALWNQVDRSRNRKATGCYQCEGKTKWTKSLIQNFLVKKGIPISIKGDFINARTKFEVTCQKCDHNWKTTMHSLNLGKGCPECNKPGRTEKAIRKFLSKVFGEEFISIRPDWLKNDWSNYNLEIDCYCEKLNLAIEVDGPHHRSFNPRFFKNKKEFAYRKKCDRIKKRKIINRGIIFISLPLDEQKRSLDWTKRLLKKKLEENKIQIPATWNSTNITIV